ncbi:hypothetical protein [Candidatus Moranella endobia]|uniref:hypothetical protein n=1 Tax=Candidatus Moranella endobia TaxID=1048758 RepID=UPI0003A91127|nr:hypothetical protein [Candidatus Moranella endobia]
MNGGGKPNIIKAAAIYLCVHASFFRNMYARHGITPNNTLAVETLNWRKKNKQYQFTYNLFTAGSEQ